MKHDDTGAAVHELLELSAMRGAEQRMRLVSALHAIEIKHESGSSVERRRLHRPAVGISDHLRRSRVGRRVQELFEQCDAVGKVVFPDAVTLWAANEHDLLGGLRAPNVIAAEQ